MKCATSGEDEYLPIKDLVPGDVVGTDRVIMISMFLKEHRREPLTRGRETKLSVVISLKSTRILLRVRATKCLNAAADTVVFNSCLRKSQ